MKIYFVTRWSNGADGFDEADTNFIVLASRFEDAAEIVDKQLIKSAPSKVKDFCQRITEIGDSYANIKEPKIILGPSIEHALYHNSIEVPNEKKWVRDSLEEGWIKYDDYY